MIDNDVGDDSINLGPCCSCGRSGVLVARILFCLPFRAPVPGTGWGCAVCGLPADGAMAVLCDDCENDDAAAVKTVCVGYPGDGKRMPIEEAEKAERFEHDSTKHWEDWRT